MEQRPEYRRYSQYGLRTRRGFSGPLKVRERGIPLTAEQNEYNRTTRAENKAIEDLENSSSRLSALFDENIFATECLSFLTSKLTGNVPQQLCSQVPNYNESSQTLSHGEEERQITVRETDAKLTRSTLFWTLHSLASHVISMHQATATQDFPEIDTPELFFRAFRVGCHSPHDKELGFRSSKPRTPPDYEACTLKESRLLDAKMLANQCEGRDPSTLIALSDSPSRILNIIKCWDFRDMEGRVIAVISSSKLKSMGVLFNRTTTLASHFGCLLRTKKCPDGLPYANENYWVAYRWIPAECIEGYITISALRTTCEKRGIEGNNYRVRLSLSDFPLESPVLPALQDLSLN